MRLLTRLLRGFIKTGTLELIDAHGSRHLFGAAPGPAVVARIHDSALHMRLALGSSTIQIRTRSSRRRRPSWRAPRPSWAFAPE